MVPIPKTKAKERVEYRLLKIPKDLAEEVDKVLGTYGYRSRTEFVKDAIRRLLKEYEPSLPPLKHFNLNEDGVLILDRTLDPPRGRIIQVFFKPDGPECELCETKRCRHIEFALTIPEVQEILREKGWEPS